MAKIRKCLSDEEMLKGFSEDLTFENGMYADEKVTKSRIKSAKQQAKKRIAAARGCSRASESLFTGNQYGMAAK